MLRVGYGYSRLSARTEGPHGVCDASCVQMSRRGRMGRRSCVTNRLLLVQVRGRVQDGGCHHVGRPWQPVRYLATREPYNSSRMGGNSASSARLHVRCTPHVGPTATVRVDGLTKSSKIPTRTTLPLLLVTRAADAELTPMLEIWNNASTSSQASARETVE